MGIALGAAGFILIWLVVGTICAGVWTGFTIRGLIRLAKGTGGPWASAMAQISVVAMLVGLLRFGPTWGIGAVLFPPALLVFIPDVAELAITPRIAVYALPITLAVLAICLLRTTLRPFAVALTSGALITSTLVAGEVISARAMCASAAEQGLTQVTRNTFLWSITSTGNDLQFGLHAMAQRGDEQVAWSYSDMAWYTLSDTIWPDVQSGEPACEL